LTTPTKWPNDIGGTTRGTGLEDAERWADERPPSVYLATRRVTMAEPARLTESDIDNANMSRALDPMTEPYVLNAMQRQAADEQAASREFAARQATNSAKGCADTSDDDDCCRSQRMPPGGFIALMLALVAVCGAVTLAVLGAR
jgi:hypothetical protein